MRATFWLTVIVSLAPLGTDAEVVAADSTVALTSVVASADLRPRTAIRVSTELLRFHVTDPNQPAVAVVTFDAGARAAATSEVLLVVDAGRPLASSESMAGEIVVTLSSDTASQPVIAGERVVAAQWVGGGLRSGQLQFELRAAPGTYSVPVKLQLIVP